MDADILGQNMEADGLQPIHVTPEEAALVRQIEGGAQGQPESAPPSRWRWNDVRTLIAPSDGRSGPLEASPSAAGSLIYVDERGNPSVNMRGDKMPRHLQRSQDDLASFMTSEMARNSMEQLRASLPRTTSNRMSGSMFVELGRDGGHSLFAGNDATGYVELSYGAGEDGYQQAMQDAKTAFGHMYDTGDATIDGGFVGRATSAGQYRGYNDGHLKDAMREFAYEAQRYMQIDPSIALDAMRSADEVGDEIKRREGRPDAATLPYSKRVATREARRRAADMMR